jgi:hypothetical protein
MTYKLFTIAAVALAASVLPAYATIITLSPLSSPTAGGSFDVALQVSDVFSADPTDAIAAFGFNIVIGDSTVLSYTGETIGSLFDDSSGFPGSPAVVGFASAGFLAAGDFTEPLTLATLHFNALKASVSAITITTDLSDANQGLFYLNAGSTSLNSTTTVNVAGATTPEPSAAILGGLALTGLFVYRVYRRRFIS